MIKPYFETELGKLYHGDCLEIMSLIDEEIDFIFADPPYGINHAEWDKEYISIEKILLDKAKGVLISCGEKNLPRCINEMGEQFKGLFYALNVNGMTRSSLGFMNIIIAVCGGKLARGQNYTKFYVTSKDSIAHPSHKPPQYMYKIINRFANENDIILDPFLGSGTTALACEKYKCRWIGIEINKEYCDIAVERIKKETAQLKFA